MRDFFVKLADELDAKGEFELADQIDDLVSTASGRNKAPLKGLDDDVKKDLMKFVHTVKDNIEDSIKALEELFRRLRYFDLVDEVKDIGLDKMLKELSATQYSADAAVRSIFSKTHGKKPSNSDISQMAEDFGKKNSVPTTPTEFFTSLKGEEDVEIEEVEDKEMPIVEPSVGLEFDETEEDFGEEYGDISEEDFEKFMDLEPDEEGIDEE